MKDYYNYVVKYLSKKTTNILGLFINLYPQKYVKHLVLYGHSKRIRNKNAARILRYIAKIKEK